MADKLLTIDQTADYLNVSPLTVSSWRTKNIGPPYIILGAKNNNANAPVKQAVRYRVSDLDAWCASRRIEPRDKALPDHLQIRADPLTSLQWMAVRDAMEEAGSIGPKGRRRAVLNALLTACATGQWPETPPGEQTWRLTVHRALEPGGWLLTAFDALARLEAKTGDNAMPFHIAVQYVIVGRAAYRQYAVDRAYRIRTDVHGPLQGRATRRTSDAVLTAVEILEGPPRPQSHVPGTGGPVSPPGAG